LDFLADESVKRILAIAAGVLGLFAIYFLLAVLSNRSVHRLADTLRRRKSGTGRSVTVQPSSRVLSPAWMVGLLVATAAGLIALFLFTTGAWR
jgi:hypothetical protein